MSRVSITLPWPDRALHSNSRAHWAVKARATKEARYGAFALARAAAVGCWPDAEILIEYYPPTRRGDPQNVPTALKAYIDGIADAMGCDDRGFRVDYPREFAGSGKPGKVVFHVIPKEKGPL